jgi:hypothetical protein
MSSSEHKTSFDLAAKGFGGAKPSVLLTTLKTPPTGITDISMEPFGVYIAKLRSGK